MKYYRELCVDLPQEYESLRQSVHRFAKEVLRPAAAALDQMAEPREESRWVPRFGRSCGQLMS